MVVRLTIRLTVVASSGDGVAVKLDGGVVAVSAGGNSSSDTWSWW